MEKSIETILPKIKQIFIKYGAFNVYIFGSAAIGKMTPESDVDFIYSFQADKDYVTYSDHYFDLLNDLETITNRQVDLIAEYTLTNRYLIEKINSQKIKIL